MNPHFHEICINGKQFSKSELQEEIANKTKAVTIPAWEKKVYAFMQQWIADGDTISLQTSGSTGKPKTIVFTKEQLIKSAQLTQSTFDLKKGDTCFLCLPAEYIAARMMIVRAFVTGMKLEMVEPTSRPFRNFDKPLDFAALTPMQLHKTAIACSAIYKLNNIKNLIIGGGDMNDDLIHLASRLINNTYLTYGMTETLTHVALRKLNEPNISPYFVALKGVSFESDQDQRLIVHAPHLTKDPILTNDIVNLISSTSFYYIGRYDLVINSGGIKIFPEKVEDKIRELTNRRLYITKVKDDILGEKVVLVLEGEAMDTTILENDMDIRLEKYEKPKDIFFMDHFEETASGKIIRNPVSVK